VVVILDSMKMHTRIEWQMVGDGHRNVVTLIQHHRRPWKLSIDKDHLSFLSIWGTYLPCEVKVEMDTGTMD